MSVGAESLLRSQLMDLVRSSLVHELELSRAIYDQRVDAAPDSLAHRLNELTSRRVTLIRPDGRVVGESSHVPGGLDAIEDHSTREEFIEARRGEIGAAVRFSGTLAAEHLYLALTADDGTVIRLAVPLAEIDATISRAQRGIFTIGLIAALVAMLLSLAASLAITRPLKRLRDAARAIARGDLSRRVRYNWSDELGDVALAFNTLADELQRRLSQLGDERAEMQALIDGMSEAVVAVGADGRVRRANPAAQTIFQLEGDPRGRLPEEISRRPTYLKLVRDAMAGEATGPIEIEDAERTLLATAHPLEDGGAVLVFLDVSELRRLEGVRRDFVANASHELKTPLTAIRGYSETLLDEDLPPELRKKIATTVRANAERLRSIVDDLLDLSRIESGGWTVRPEPLHIGEAADQAWSEFSDAAESEQIEFVTEIGPDADWVSADPAGLHQILTNLFANAIRHTPRGGRISVTAEVSDHAMISIAVNDTGSGIPPSHLPRVFERFYRVDTARSRDEGGTGLGLSIVRHLVEQHGGAIKVESVVGKGTSFVFTLPQLRDES